MLPAPSARWTPLFSVNIHVSSIPYPVAFGSRCFNLKRTIIAQGQRSDLPLNVSMILLLLLLVPNILRIISPKKNSVHPSLNERTGLIIHNQCRNSLRVLNHWLDSQRNQKPILTSTATTQNVSFSTENVSLCDPMIVTKSRFCTC